MNRNMQKNTNRLINESSPYLLQHAHNPVNWRAWNDETLCEARASGKPMLISIGYSACHWCHVMEEESFSDSEVAAIMNRDFTCIKIDREERPDLDHFFMSAVQSIKGSGGWPLNCFAFPDGKPFWGGTYFRKDQWLALLNEVARVFSTQERLLYEQAENIIRTINDHFEKIENQAFVALKKEDISLMLENLHRVADEVNGGFGVQPKFPMPVVIDLQIFTHNYTGNRGLPDHVALTLNNMAMGGIFDQVGGGFARYSTDSEWHIPHFEKMLYDNVQLAAVYLEAFRISKNELFKETAIRTLNFLIRELGSDTGAFFTALDADSDGKEGAFYTWTEEEIKKTLGQDAELFSGYFDLGNHSYWENNLNILRRKYTPESYAAIKGIDKEFVKDILSSNIEKLLSERSRRNYPLRDEKIITSINAMAVNCFLVAYEVTDDKEYLETALKTARFIRNNLIKENQVFHAFSSGKPYISGMLEDYSQVINAFLELYSAVGDDSWFNLAEDLTTKAIENFYDQEKKIFWLSAFDSQQDYLRSTDLHDGVIPSPVSVMAHNLFIIGHLSYNMDYLRISKSLTGMMKKNVLQHPVSYANWAKLLLKMSAPFYLISVRGKNSESIVREIKAQHRSDCLIAPFKGLEQKYQISGNNINPAESLIYICTDGHCYEPVGSLAEMSKITDKTFSARG